MNILKGKSYDKKSPSNHHTKNKDLRDLVSDLSTFIQDGKLLLVKKEINLLKILLGKPDFTIKGNIHPTISHWPTFSKTSWGAGKENLHDYSFFRFYWFRLQYLLSFGGVVFDSNVSRVTKRLALSGAKLCTTIHELAKPLRFYLRPSNDLDLETALIG